MTEPWLRGTLTEVDAVRRQVLHALELALEDAAIWCAGLTNAEFNARPFGVASVAFHLRHISRSLDRLLTYAEGKLLSVGQLEALRTELLPGAEVQEVLREFELGVRSAMERVRRMSGSYEDVRAVGRERLPSTVGGLLVHCAEHTQRHVGQVVTTCQVMKGMQVL